MMERIGKKINLHGAKLHVLRHTFVTTAAEAGIGVKALQSIAGHSDAQITMNVYNHARQKAIMQEAEKIAGMYNAVM